VDDTKADDDDVVVVDADDADDDDDEEEEEDEEDTSADELEGDFTSSVLAFLLLDGESALVFSRLALIID
jgi:hypothetical protein